jgi:hypothetical protein
MWLYNGKEFTSDMKDDYVGFVYLIENLDNGMKYIGKKLFTSSKTYQRNKKKKRMRVESNWNEYTGSNELLNEHVSNGANLQKTILYLCKSKGWMSYFETLEILQRQAIQSDEFYNAWVSCKIQRKHLT